MTAKAKAAAKAITTEIRPAHIPRFRNAQSVNKPNPTARVSKAALWNAVVEEPLVVV